MKRGFTLVEMLVVVAMLAVLMGAFGTSFAKARRRAMIAKATQDVREMTNAILAYENYAPNRSLKNQAKGAWQDADESSLGIILGSATTETGAQIPVLYNAQLTKGRILDPWGNPYQFIIKNAGSITPKSASTYMTAASLPNFYRLTDEERE
jgi:prepilin-type N-terminal cleavage/methylation domain-containing protein